MNAVFSIKYVRNHSLLMEEIYSVSADLTM
jgi:hypothetical protein